MGCKAIRIVFIFTILIVVALGLHFRFYKRGTTPRKFEVIKTVAVSRGYIDRKRIQPQELAPSTQPADTVDKVEEEEDIQKDDKGVENQLFEEGKYITLMTFNIRHGVDKDGKESLHAIIKKVKDAGAKIIALQEVDRLMPRSGFKDQAKEIAEALGYHYVYGETINLLGVKYGNALISHYPIIEYENKKLPNDRLETRGLLKAEIDIEGTVYHVYTTHLGLSYREREKQIESINKVLEGEKERVVLMGDFNGQPDNPEMEKIHSRIVDSAVVTNNEKLNTYAFYSEQPNTRIDRIYLSKDIQIVDHYTLPSEISDHHMVLTTIYHMVDKKEGITMFMENNN